VIKAEFPASLLQSSVSHDPSRNLSFYLISDHYQCWKQLCCNNIYSKFTVFFFQIFLMSKDQINSIVWNIKLFFYLWLSSLSLLFNWMCPCLNKSVHFFQKGKKFLPTSNVWAIVYQTTNSSTGTLYKQMLSQKQTLDGCIVQNED